jgi:NAD(P)-dependent dehydrogenase (short-subunit alcohol dehydrogenase family)
MGLERFAGKVALVTGATSGMGQEIAVRLASEGAVVAVNQRPTGDPTRTLKRIAAVGGDGFPVIADVRDPGQVQAMVDETARRAGRLDLLVSNAAVNPIVRWDETTLDLWDELSETNLRGTWLVTTAAAKEMIHEGHGGAIVCISSISAHVGAPGQVAYCATKGGISMLAKALGAVLGDHGIRINAVEPGAIDTRMAAPLLDSPTDLAYYLERIPLHRVGTPADIAGTVAFLLSDDAAYITSATLLVDGGFIVNAER